jgi:peptidoglycan/LPS O-acetylase OafA/YrhL
MRSPLRTFVDGGLQVEIFFVLSGFVIANAALRRKHGFLRNLFVRYLRLTVPAAASVAFSLLCLWIFPHEFAQLRASTHFPWLDTQPLAQVVTLQGPVRFSTREIIHDALGPCFGGTNYINTVLWTMKGEFIGSCGLYFLYAFLVNRKTRLVLLLTLLLFLVITKYVGYAPFVVGAVLLELWQKDQLRLRSAALVIFLGAIVPCELVWTGSVGRLLGSPLMIVAASAIVYVCLLSPRAIRFMSARPSRFLGRVSFPLYLVHYPIMCGLGIYIWLHIQNRLLATLLSLVVTVLSSLVIAFAGEVLVDAPTVRALRFVDFPSWPSFIRKSSR